MDSQQALQEAIKNTKAKVLGNGTNKISLVCEYPTFDVTLDNNLNFDILILPTVELPQNEIIAVKVGSNEQKSFTLSSNKKAIWLSELIGSTRVALKTKVTETIEFDFAKEKLLQFELIVALETNFKNSEDIIKNGLSSEQFLIAKTSINPFDESSASAIRHAIDNTNTNVLNNNTNIVAIKNTYPVFGTQLPKTYVVDMLITFANPLSMGSEIFIKKNGIAYKKVVVSKNIKNIWYSDLIGETRETLFSKVSEEYELVFVYNQTINVKLITGELTNFINANVVANQLTYGLFELADSNSFANIPIEVNNCDFVIVYDDYGSHIKSAKLDLGNEQYISTSFVIDNSTTPSKKYLKISHVDEGYNVEINMLTDINGIKNYLELLRDMARELYEK